MTLEIRRFRKRPVVVEAVRYTGWSYGPQIAQWCGGVWHKVEGVPFGEEWIDIPTLEGTMRVDVGNWVVRGTRGEFYPVKDAPFWDTFEEVAERVAEGIAQDAQDSSAG